MKFVTPNFKLFSALLFCLSLFMASCSVDNESLQKEVALGKMDIIIPAELKGNKQLETYIKDMSKIADEYAQVIDKLVSEVHEYKGKNISDLNMIEKVELTSLTAEVAMETGRIMTQWGQAELKRTSLNEGLNPEQLKAMDLVWDRFEKRIDQIKAKHGEFFLNGIIADIK